MKKSKPVRIVQFEPCETGPWENAERMAAIIRKARKKRRARKAAERAEKQ